MSKYFLPSKFYYISLVIVLGCISLHSTHDVGKTGKCFNDNIGILEIIFSFIQYLVFGFFFIAPNGRMNQFYSGGNAKYKKNNKFYCWLMFFTCQFVVFFLLHFLNNSTKDENAIHNAMKIWEIAAYLVTTIYNLWFWLSKDRGREIIKDRITGDKDNIVFFIVLANVGLLFIAIAHSLIYLGVTIFNETISHFIEGNEIWISLLLILSVYFLFCGINVKIFNNTNHDETKKDFQTMYKYIDNPTRIIFGILFVFSLYMLYLGTISKMEGFFSGAIAFELILSSIVWANTESA